MAESGNTWFLEQRALWLAALFFNRQPGVRVTEWKQDESLDLVIALDKEENALPQFLGVVSIGVTHEEELPTSYNIPRSSAGFYDATRFPILLLVFTMQKADQGYFRWLQEPTLLGIESRKSGEWTLLTDATLAPIIAQVSAWYNKTPEGSAEG